MPATPTPHGKQILNRLLVVLLALTILSGSYLLGLSHGSELGYERGYDDGLAYTDATMPAGNGLLAIGADLRTGGSSGVVTAVTGTQITLAVEDAADPATTIETTFDLRDARVLIRTAKDPSMFEAELRAHTEAFARFESQMPFEPAEGVAPPEPPAPPTPFIVTNGSVSDIMVGDALTIYSGAAGVEEVVVNRSAAEAAVSAEVPPADNDPADDAGDDVESPENEPIDPADTP